MQTLKRLYDFCQRKSRLQKKKRVVFLILAIIPVAFLKLLKIMKTTNNTEKPEKLKSVADPLTMLKLQKS